MNATEQKLWHKIHKAVRGASQERWTRIETSTVDGVSDVEYVTEKWHGWIELKVSHTLPDKSALTLGSEFTAEQARWLLAHHDPARCQRSWLLIGFAPVRAARWREFWLLTARQAVPIALANTVPTSRWIRRVSIQDILTDIRE